MMEIFSKKILIIIPAYNEEGNIVKTIDEFLSLQYPFTILVVNYGSKDQTAYEAKKLGVQVISLPFNLGIGGAVQTGFKYAYQHHFDVAVQVDGDGQHKADFLKKIMDPVLQDEVDMAIGSRFIPPYTGYQSSFIRRIGINFFAILISWLTDSKVTDPTSGFRVFNRKLIKVFAEYYPSDFPEPEAIVIARRYDARIKEVPVEMRQRICGNSSIRYLKTLYYMIKVTFAILLDKIKTTKTYQDVA